MDFEWGPDKEKSNQRKHGVSFLEASTVFGDPRELTIYNPDHSEGEYRFLSIGQASSGRLLVVSYTEREENGFELLTQDWLLWQRRNDMNQKTDTNDMRPEYDFYGGMRGKHYKAYQEDTNVVLLEPEVARVFSDSASVNQALRMLIDLADEVMQKNPTGDSK